MKKITVALIATLLTVTAFAQDKKKPFVPKVYGKVGLGYSVAQGGAVQAPLYSLYHTAFYPINGSYSGFYSGNVIREDFDVKSSSFSAGMRAVVGMGVMVTKHIGVELNADIGIAPSTMESRLFEDGGQTNITIDVSQKANTPILLTPSLLVQSGGKINLYMRGGIVVPVRTVIQQDINYQEDVINPADSSIVTTVYNVGEEYKLTLSPGFAGAAGVKVKAGKFMEVWGEVSVVSMTLYYKESEITQFDVDGFSVLNQIPPNRIKSKYERQGTYTSNSNVYPTAAVPFNNVGINVGVAFNLP